MGKLTYSLLKIHVSLSFIINSELANVIKETHLKCQLSSAGKVMKTAIFTAGKANASQQYAYYSYIELP